MSTKSSYNVLRATSVASAPSSSSWMGCMKRGVVNKKWREYVAEDATCGENDRRIGREVKVPTK